MRRVLVSVEDGMRDSTEVRKVRLSRRVSRTRRETRLGWQHKVASSKEHNDDAEAERNWRRNTRKLAEISGHELGSWYLL